jgi:Zn finger protein HypA/HybF involved in hydrogenase expression
MEDGADYGGGDMTLRCFECDHVWVCKAQSLACPECGIVSVEMLDDEEEE